MAINHRNAELRFKVRRVSVGLSRIAMEMARAADLRDPNEVQAEFDNLMSQLREFVEKNSNLVK